jgi:diguanylate cyclase (GGDEF)-like protein/PAS domain S-box-containing protein
VDAGDHSAATSISRLEGILEAASDAIVSIDARQNILVFNRAAEETFGYSRSEVIGQPIALLLPKRYRKSHGANVSGFAEESAPWRKMNGARPEVLGRRKSGEEFPAEVTISKVHLDGEWLFTAVVRDVTERVTAERKQQSLTLRLEGILSAASDAIVSVDEHQRIVLFNRAAEETFGFTADEVLGLSLSILLPRRFRTEHEQNIRDFGAEPAAWRQMSGQRPEVRGRRKGGAEFPAEATISKINLDGQMIYTAIVRDVTERVQAEQERMDAAARNEAVLATAADGIFTFDEDMRIESFNRAAERMFGRSVDDVVGSSLRTLLSTEDLEAFHSLVDTILIGELPDFPGIERELIGRRGDDETFPLLAAFSEVETAGRRLFTAIARDVSERKAFEQRIEHQSLHDSLTGLANRSLLLEQLRFALKGAAPAEEYLALLFLDIDRFKAVNDIFGHAVGDLLLEATADALRAVVRPSDTVARFGGDEFVVLCTGLRDPNEAGEIAERFFAALCRPLDLAGHLVDSSVSIGIAIGHPKETTPDDMMRDADIALYRAKERGRARVEVFDTEMKAWVRSRAETERALRRGIDELEIVVHYQPMIELGGGRVIGVEALARWQRGDQLVPPRDFIGLAEDTGLIVPLGLAVLETACRQVVAWNANRRSLPLTLAVNISPRQLAHVDAVASIADVLSRTGIPASLVTLEITESVALDPAARALETLASLRELGVRLALDDFGTGYSSLSHLRQLPVQILKIDRSFVSALTDTHADDTIVAATISMGHAFGMTVIAEGVERPHQLERLRVLGCEVAQGFLLGAPVPAGELMDVLDRAVVMSDERSTV